MDAKENEPGQAPRIAVRGVTVRAGDTTILDDIDFSISEGERVCVYGPSGSGKSSLLRTIVGAMAPSEGSVAYRGVVLTAANIDDLRGDTGWIGQKPVAGSETARESLLLPFRFRRHRDHEPDEDAITNAIEQVGLEPALLDRDSDDLSGGELQRIIVARSLLLGVTLFLADEPTSSLDAESRRHVIDALAGDGFTVLVATHDRDWIGACERFIRIEKGAVVSVDEEPDMRVFEAERR